MPLCICTWCKDGVQLRPSGRMIMSQKLPKRTQNPNGLPSFFSLPQCKTWHKFGHPRSRQTCWLLSPNCHALSQNVIDVPPTYGIPFEMTQSNSIWRSNIFSYQTNRSSHCIYPVRYHYPHIWWRSLHCGWFIPHLLMVKNVQIIFQVPSKTLT